MYQRNLLPTDGSGASRRAIRAGVELARKVGAEVVAMTAIPAFRSFAAGTDAIEQARQQYEAVTPARRGLAGLLLGSETWKVLVHGTIPVPVHR